MGGYVQNYYEEKFIKTPGKQKMSINLNVNKTKPNRQKRAHGVALLIVTAGSYVSCISSTIGQGPNNSSSKDNRLGFMATTTTFPTEASAFSTKASAFPIEASDSQAHLEN